MAKSRMTVAEVRQRISKRMPGKQGEEIVKAFEGLEADLTKVKTWADTLVAKLNADAGVTDTNYASPDI